MSTGTDLRKGAGPVLADGTTLRELVDPVRREVLMRVLTDPEIYRLELKRIHGRSWVGLAHVNEIPNAGDFVLRHIGEDPVIVTRRNDGEFSVLLNVCAHRGMEVCWADAGNQSQFKCPYHGWVFSDSGKLLGAPFEQEMYGDWDKSQFGLRTARVEVRSGFVYATFGADTPPLDEWLGDAGWYVDTCDTGDMEPVGPPWRLVVPANWKLSIDQFCGDSYHAVTLHGSLRELGLLKGNDPKALGLDTVHVSTPQGHGVFAFPADERGAFGTKRDPDADPYAIEGRHYSCELFPQTVVSGRAVYAFPDGSRIGTGNLITLNPKGPNAYEWQMLWLIDKSAPAEIKKLMQRFSAPQMAFAADDFEQAPSMQRSARGLVGQEQPMRYNALQGEVKPKGWTGPGTVHAGIAKDDSQWRLWQRWLEMLTD
jgi:phenylpropionate dioxygenase-like ring-hydroxylating dioxygenase large terminal subunit